MNEKLPTVTATDAVMKFWFVTPRLILISFPSTVGEPRLASSRALGGAVLNWQLSGVGYINVESNSVYLYK